MRALVAAIGHSKTNHLAHTVFAQSVTGKMMAFSLTIPISKVEPTRCHCDRHSKTS